MRGAKNDAGTFATPDFAFPKTVSTNARPVLKSALKSGDSEKALQAAMQIVIAENLVSRSNAAKGAALLDSVAALLPQPYSSLGYILEARLYSDVYEADRWTFDRRTIPVEPQPQDIMEWSRDIFSRKVVELTEKGMQGTSEAKEMEIDRISMLITDSREATEYGLTVYDFMTLQGLRNLQTFCNSGSKEIPFFGGVAKGNRATEYTASELSSLIMAENLKWYETRGLSAASAVMDGVASQRLDTEEDDAFLNRCVKKYEETPWCAGFILALYRNEIYPDADPVRKREGYKRASDYLRAFPDCRGAEALKALTENLKAQRIHISATEQNLPGKEIKGKVKFENIDSFYILAVRVPEEALEKNMTEAAVAAGVKPSAVVRIDDSGADLSLPYSNRLDFTLPALEPGVYALLASRTPDRSGLISNPERNPSVPVMLVSRLSRFVVFGQEEGNSYADFYLTEGTNGAPVAGAKVIFTPEWNNKDWKKTILETDREGRVRIPKGNYKVRVKAGEDILCDHVYSDRSYSKPGEVLEGRLFTSLSIYRPGDKMQFGGVVYVKNGQELRAAQDKNLTLVLRDANYQARDTISILTDRFGRLNGEFNLPTDGLAGGWMIGLMNGESHIGQAYFNVEEYKSPTFYLTLSGTEGEVKIGETVRIKGEVKSYSGMPVADAEVKFDVTYTPGYFFYNRFSSGNANYGGTVTTGSDGRFTIELPTANLKNTPYAFGRYRLNATATNGAGETQVAPALSFHLGEAYSIVPDLPEKMEVGAGKPTDAKVTVFDMLGKPVKRKVYYRIENFSDSAQVVSGECESGRFTFDFTTLESGKYRMLFSVEPDFRKSAENEVYEEEMVIWRKNDKRPPYDTPLWVPENEIIIPSEAKGNVKVKVGGSSPDGMLFAEVTDLNGTVERKWLPVSDNIVEIPVKRPGDLERVRINLTGTYNLTSKGETVTLIPEIQTEGLQIQTETFRDLLTPGAKEQWKFLFTFSDRRMAGLPVMAVLSNKALNALAPFSWDFNPYGSLYWRVPGNIDVEMLTEKSWSFAPSRSLPIKYDSFAWPEWNTYGRGLYGGDIDGIIYNLNATHIRGGMMRKSAASAAKTEDIVSESIAEEKMMASADVAFDNMVLEESPVMTAGNAYNDNGSMAADEAPLREVECPLAFFMPDLSTDKDGVATLDFTVPEFNGSWQLQVMGYTEDMRGAVLRKDAVSSKPVMAQMNAPRFARTGDLLSVSCTVYNNTSAVASLGGRIVFFNPLTDEIYASRDFDAEEVSSMGARVISESLRIPSEINVLGIRVYGESVSARDGEQTVVPVYPSSTPVVESKPFWLSPGEKTLTVKIPDAKKDGVMTLSYTDNPVWECLTALPAMKDTDSDNVLAQSAVLYATAMADGLLKRYPSLSEAIRLFSDPSMSGDSTLVSNLEKNPQLKTVALGNTPWVRSAQTETLRMQNLIGYLDHKKGEQAVKETVDKLALLQHTDGGWSWCPGMESSVWITSSVLNDFAMLRRAGYLPSGCDSQAKKGFGYVEKEIVKDWKKSGSSNYSYTSLLDYLYLRSIYGYSGGSSDFNKIKTRAVAEIEKGWKTMDIYSKATAAVLLYREGRKATASQILESLGEFASVTKEKGMWFDNLSSGFLGKGKLLTTARVLEAWHEIAPQAPAIDLLRQWILLSKQVEDWGGGPAAATLVNTVLTSGSRWTATASTPSIYLDGEKVEVGKIGILTGSLTLPLKGNGGTLTIERDAAGPAWGGVISQYVAPIKDVKSARSNGFSVDKNLYVITNDTDGTTAKASDLKVGDRVRVTLTLKTDRDLQYVAVTDSRATCLEPADKVSGYTSSDGVWMYREIRNNAVNLFIPYLGKGTHVISYDCFVDRVGDYASGIATAQSQYAPAITAHSAGEIIRVETK